MAKFARVVNGRVAEVITLPDGMDYRQAFHADIASTLVQVPNGVAVATGMVYQGNIFSPATPPAVPVPSLLKYAARIRYIKAHSGITVAISGVGTVPVGTDELGMGLLNGAVIRQTQAEPPATLPWTVGGQSWTITAAQLQQIFTAVNDYMLGCFATLQALNAGIQAAPPTITTLAQVESAGWPSAAR